MNSIPPGLASNICDYLAKPTSFTLFSNQYPQDKKTIYLTTSSKTNIHILANNNELLQLMGSCGQLRDAIYNYCLPIELENELASRIAQPSLIRYLTVFQRVIGKPSSEWKKGEKFKYLNFLLGRSCLVAPRYYSDSFCDTICLHSHQNNGSFYFSYWYYAVPLTLYARGNLSSPLNLEDSYLRQSLYLNHKPIEGPLSLFLVKRWERIWLDGRTIEEIRGNLAMYHKIKTLYADQIVPAPSVLDESYKLARMPIEFNDCRNITTVHFRQHLSPKVAQTWITHFPKLKYITCGCSQFFERPPLSKEGHYSNEEFAAFQTLSNQHKVWFHLITRDMSLPPKNDPRKFHIIGPHNYHDQDIPPPNPSRYAIPSWSQGARAFLWDIRCKASDILEAK